jgi:hypothetical protein
MAAKAPGRESRGAHPPARAFDAVIGESHSRLPLSGRRQALRLVLWVKRIPRTRPRDARDSAVPGLIVPRSDRRVRSTAREKDAALPKAFRQRLGQPQVGRA